MKKVGNQDILVVICKKCGAENLYIRDELFHAHKYQCEFCKKELNSQIFDEGYKGE